MEASKCPKCGDEPHFVESVEKWYCYGCNSYIDDDECVHGETEHDLAAEEQTKETSEELHPNTESGSQICKGCGAELEQIKDGKLYCYVCETYPGETESETKPELEPAAEVTEPEIEALAHEESVPESPAVQISNEPP